MEPNNNFMLSKTDHYGNTYLVHYFPQTNRVHSYHYQELNGQIQQIAYAKKDLVENVVQFKRYPDDIEQDDREIARINRGLLKKVSMVEKLINPEMTTITGEKNYTIFRFKCEKPKV